VVPQPGNLLATPSGDLVYLDFGMMSTAPQVGEDEQHERNVLSGWTESKQGVGLSKE